MEEIDGNADVDKVQEDRRHPVREFCQKHEKGLKVAALAAAATSITVAAVVVTRGIVANRHNRLSLSINPLTEIKPPVLHANAEIASAVEKAKVNFDSRIIDTQVVENTVEFTIKSASGKSTWPQSFELAKNAAGTWEPVKRGGTMDNGCAYSRSLIPGRGINAVLRELNG